MQRKSKHDCLPCTQQVEHLAQLYQTRCKNDSAQSLNNIIFFSTKKITPHAGVLAGTGL